MHTYSCGRVQNQCGPAGLRKPRESRCCAEVWTGTGDPGLEGRSGSCECGKGRRWEAVRSPRFPTDAQPAHMTSLDFWA